jgi:hypothetical protein
MLFFGSISARIVVVDNETTLIATMRNAVAGDTIAVAGGTYTGDMNQSGDPGNLPNGTGYFWIGNDGAAGEPIVVIGKDGDDPSILRGSSIDSGYVIHVTGNHVVLKNLTIHTADKGVVFDNSSHSILEDCQIYNSGAELVHVRDSSCNVTISRNQLYSSGNGGRGSIGEGIYVGTDQARWGADDVPQSQWGDKAISEGYGGYDWRVHNTRVLCNYLSGGISAECLDIKEGTRNTLVENNMLVGDSIGLKPGAKYYDDSFIDQKGVEGTFIDNSFCECGNSISKYISEVTRKKYAHIPDSLTADGHASPWCDTGDEDGNDCSPENNTVVSTPRDPRGDCAPVFPFDYAVLASTGATGGAEAVTDRAIGQFSIRAVRAAGHLQLTLPAGLDLEGISIYDSHGRTLATFREIAAVQEGNLVQVPLSTIGQSPRVLICRLHRESSPIHFRLVL